MTINITAKHLQLSDPIRKYVEEKIKKVQKYFNQITRVQVILSVEKLVHNAEIVAHAPKQTLRALAQGSNLYAAIDLASDKIDAQLKKHKERLRNHHDRKSEAVTANFGTEFVGASRFSVVKQVPMQPMSPEMAANEMESVGHTFWMFLDEKSKQVNVIFRRQDDSYGILKPVKWNGK